MHTHAHVHASEIQKCQHLSSKLIFNDFSQLCEFSGFKPFISPDPPVLKWLKAKASVITLFCYKITIL